MTNEQPALLLIGHGSRSGAGVDQYWALADLVRRLRPHVALGCGFIELARPHLDSAIDDLVDGGATSVIGVPLVLLGAGHLKTDGPAALARGRAAHPGVHFSYARDLGIHPSVLAVAEERIRAAQADGGPDAAVVLVGRGSTDPDANADLYKVGRLLSDSRGLGLVEPAFVSLARPSVTDALDRCRRLGAASIAVVPYFLFTGLLVERISRQARDWAAEHPDTGVVVGRELGPDDRVASLVIERYDEARGGGAVMNCDCCIYRTALPGYEDRVGTRVTGATHAH
ncbi:MAG TPA: sirohydrochlorin chelatase [Acidimicrobiales bacterium]|nr:sirohydrochlorin chelatase [Acidimicrobiales bacterium]